MSQREFEVTIGRLLGVDDHGLLTRALGGLRPRPEILNLIQRTRGAGIRVGLLSNSWGDGEYDPYAGYDLDSIFDAVVISGDTGTRKPDAAIYLIARILGILYIVVVPCIAALLLTALLQPLTARLRRAGLPGLAATWVTLLIAAAVLGGLILLVSNRVAADYPTMVAEVKHTTTQVESLLSGPPFRVKSTTVKNLLNNVPGYLSKHKSLVEGTVVTGGKIVAEGLGGLVLMLFVTFFLIKDGERIWNWLLGAMRTLTDQLIRAVNDPPSDVLDAVIRPRLPVSVISSGPNIDDQSALIQQISAALSTSNAVSRWESTMRIIPVTNSVPKTSNSRLRSPS